MDVGRAEIRQDEDVEGGMRVGFCSVTLPERTSGHVLGHLIGFEIALYIIRTQHEHNFLLAQIAYRILCSR